jgi:hypothetical protein
MNYARIYNLIIENRLKNPLDGYTEKHHIIPVSLGGSDSKDNLVRLTAREHFICHWLLVKMYKNNKISYYKMLKAFNMMCNATTGQQQRHYVFSRIFSKYREDLSKAMSALQVGNNNSQAGTMWICNLITEKNMKIPKGEIPTGWIAGRNKWKIPKTKTTKEPKEKLSKKYLHGFQVSVNEKIYDSISHAADSLGIGHETARMRFKSKSFPEYKILSR